MAVAAQRRDGEFTRWQADAELIQRVGAYAAHLADRDDVAAQWKRHGPTPIPAAATADPTL